MNPEGFFLETEKTEAQVEIIKESVSRAITAARESNFDTEAIRSWIDQHNQIIVRFLSGELDRESFDQQLEESRRQLDDYEGKVDFTDFEDFYNAVEIADEQLGHLIEGYSPQEIAGHEYSHAQVWLQNGITPFYRLGFYRDSLESDEASAFAEVELAPDQLTAVDDATLRDLIITSTNAPDFLSESDEAIISQ